MREDVVIWLLLVGWLGAGFLSGYWIPEFAQRRQWGPLALAIFALIASYGCGLTVLA